jgi:taurine dioxygenase
LLFEHVVQPEFTLRHHWAAGDAVMWDNRATLHYAADDYGQAERRMRRITLRGTRPLGPSFQESRLTNDPLVSIR